MKNPLVFVLMIGMMMPLFLYTQVSVNERSKMHHEVPNSASEYMPLKNAATTPAYTFQRDGLFTIQVNIDEDGNNIIGDAANEPSIAIDPTNPDRIMIGWRQFDNIISDFRQAGYAYSLDGGQSWTSPDPIDLGVFRSDPVLGSDPDGNFYYNSLTLDANNDFLCTVYKTADGEVEWDDGTFAYGGDKQWMIIDNTDGMGAGNNYSAWNRNYSSCYPGFFTRSSDFGASFEPCILVLGDPYWGTLAVGPEGELYIAGAGGSANIMLAKSVNAHIPGSTLNWSTYTEIDLGGYISGWTPVNPQGLMGQVYVDVDVSGGPGHGNVYVLASVVRPGLDAADVMLARSTDGGMSFDPPVRINDDPDNSEFQWFGTMSVAPNGRIDVVWLDTRVDPLNGFSSALFYSYSIDQGETWSVNTQLSDAFDPHVGWPQQQKMGDYYHMLSDEGGAHLAWANTINGGQDVFYSYIEPEVVGIKDLDDHNFMSISNYPNPFDQTTRIRFTLAHKSRVHIKIYDVFGKQIAEPASNVYDAGIHTIVYDAGHLKKGVYIAKLFAGSQQQSLRMVKVGDR
jgi:hypothetical protein